MSNLSLALALSLCMIAGTATARADERSDRVVMVQFDRAIGFGEGAIWLTDLVAERLSGRVFWRSKFTPGLCAIRVVPGTAAEAETILRHISFVEQADRTSRGGPGGYYHRVVREPNDPNYSDQWGLEYIRAPEAWEIRTDASDIVVAVVDTGVFWPHPDLVDNILFENNAVKGAAFYFDPWCLYGDPPNEDDPLEYQSKDFPHGTPVASIIGARGDNETDVCGVAWKAKIMPVAFGFEFAARHCDDRICTGDSFVGAVAALEYAIENGARVINLSSGWTADAGSALLSTLIAADWADVLVVVCAHNDGLELPNSSARQFPAIYSASFANVITVGAVGPSDDFKNYSNDSPTYVQIGAPSGPDNDDVGLVGIRVVGSAQYGQVGYCPNTVHFGGTSAAAPFVSGAAALVWSEYPTLTAAQVRTRILNGARTVAELEAYFQNGRVLDLYGALAP